MKTILELEEYLEENCYSFLELSIGKHHAPEGIIIEADNGKYNYSYSERGNKRVIKSFSTEHELVNYALTDIHSNEWANAHIVANTFDKKSIEEAGALLEKMKIKYKRNDVPYYKDGKTAYRIFVFGKDILRLVEFKKKYMCYLR